MQGDLASSRFLIVVGGQDGYGQGKLSAVDENPSTWVAGGGSPPNSQNLEKYHSTIWDVLLPESVNQEEMLGSYDVEMMAYSKLEGVELPPIQQQVYGLNAIGVSGSSALLSWSTAKAGGMRVLVTGESGTVIDETWTSTDSDNLRLVNGLEAGSTYTATVMAEGASESIYFVTSDGYDQDPPEMLGAGFGEDSGEYQVSFYTTEPSSIVFEVCTNASCTNTQGAQYPTDRVHDYTLSIPSGNHTIRVQYTDVSGNSGDVILIQSGDLGEPPQPNDADNGAGLDEVDAQSDDLGALIILLAIFALTILAASFRSKSPPDSTEIEFESKE